MNAISFSWTKYVIIVWNWVSQLSLRSTWNKKMREKWLVFFAIILGLKHASNLAGERSIRPQNIKTTSDQDDL